nr:MAG TPA: protein of unknown function (DUF4111) [Caudoviricetes sp.]
MKIIINLCRIFYYIIHKGSVVWKSIFWRVIL